MLSWRNLRVIGPAEWKIQNRGRNLGINTYLHNLNRLISGDWKRLFYGFIPLVITVLVFFPVLKNGFVWDDSIYLQVQLPAYQSYWDAFFPGSQVQFAVYYRPLIVVSYLFDRSIWGLDPFGYHLTGLLLHLACTLMVFLLLVRLIKEQNKIPWGSMAASGLFGLHPIHTESVAWMSGRTDVMAALFMLASIFCLIRGGLNKPPLLSVLGSAFFFLMALLSKETAASLLLIFPFIPMLWRREASLFTWRETLRILVFPGIAFILYLVLRNFALENVMGEQEWNTGSFWESGITLILAYGFYVWKMIWPFPLNAFIANIPSSIFYYVISLFFVSGGLWLAIRGYKKKQPYIFLGLAWLFITLLPSVLVSLTSVPTPLAERYTYIPSFGFSLFIGGLVQGAIPWVQGKWALKGLTEGLVLGIFSAVIGVWMVGMSYGTRERLPIWKDNLSFWRDTVQKNPKEWLPHQNLGLIYNDHSRFNMAEEQFLLAKGFSDKPVELAATMTSIGITQMRQGKNREAERSFIESLRSGVASPYVYYALGFLYTYQWEPGIGNFKSDQARWNRIKILYQKAVELNPYYIQAYFQLGEMSMKRGLEEAARKAYERVFTLSSGTPSPMRQRAATQLAEIHFQKAQKFFPEGNFKEAMEEYQKSLGYRPQRVEGHYQLGLTLAALGQYDLAIGEYRLTLEINPRHVQARFHLGSLLEKMGKGNLARKEYQSLLSSNDPESQTYHQELEKRIKFLSIP